jgi:hypothetical protein
MHRTHYALPVVRSPDRAEIVVRDPPKLVPQELMRVWVREWNKDGAAIDPKKLMAQIGPRRFLQKRWIVERTISLGWDRIGG